MAKGPTAPSVPANPNAPANPNTPAGGTPPAGEKVKRAPIVRVTHPALMPNEKGEPTVKLDAWPTDFSSVKHKALRPNDFTSESVFLIQQAETYEKKAVALRKQAEDCKLLGSTEDRKKVKKVRDIIGQLGDLTKDLAGKGVNIADMIQGLSALLTKQADEAKAAAANPPVSAASA